MIEQMKFISISGPRDDLDRMVNQILSHYEIHLENAMSELKSVSKLIPFPVPAPTRSRWKKSGKCSEVPVLNEKALHRT